MSGYSKIYCIGGEGGFMGSDGMNPIDFQILVGDGNRQWLEVKYFNSNIRPMGRVRVIIPKGPDPIYKDALLDACLAFFPEYFQKSLSLTKVVEAVGNAKRLDFDADGEPDGWAELREEARLLFGQLIIYKAELIPLNSKTDMGPMVKENDLSEIKSLLKDMVAEAQIIRKDVEDIRKVTTSMP